MSIFGVNLIFRPTIFLAVLRPGIAKCVACKKDIHYGSKGLQQIIRHLSNRGHSNMLADIATSSMMTDFFGMSPSASSGNGNQPALFTQTTAVSRQVSLADRISNAEVNFLFQY